MGLLAVLRKESIKLGWSEKRPTEEGYYQLRDFFESTDDYMDEIVQVSKGLGLLIVWFHGSSEEELVESPRFDGCLWKELIL